MQSITDYDALKEAILGIMNDSEFDGWEPADTYEATKDWTKPRIACAIVIYSQLGGTFTEKKIGRTMNPGKVRAALEGILAGVPEKDRKQAVTLSRLAHCYPNLLLYSRTLMEGKLKPLDGYSGQPVLLQDAVLLKWMYSVAVGPQKMLLWNDITNYMTIKNALVNDGDQKKLSTSLDLMKRTANFSLEVNEQMHYLMGIHNSRSTIPPLVEKITIPPVTPPKGTGESADEEDEANTMTEKGMEYRGLAKYIKKLYGVKISPIDSTALLNQLIRAKGTRSKVKGANVQYFNKIEKKIEEIQSVDAMLWSKMTTAFNEI